MLPCELGAPSERKPRCQPGDPKRDGDTFVEPLGHRIGVARVNQRALGHRAERSDRRVEVHALSIQRATPSRPATDGSGGLPARAPRADRDVDGIETGRQHLHDRLIGAGRRLLELIGTRHPVCVQDGSSHGPPYL